MQESNCISGCCEQMSNDERNRAYNQSGEEVARVLFRTLTVSASFFPITVLCDGVGVRHPCSSFVRSSKNKRGEVDLPQPPLSSPASALWNAAT